MSIKIFPTKTPLQPELGLYIHIPFCKTICLYCNFLTFAHKNRWIPQYIAALENEIEQKSRQYQNYQIVTIYFGGGTPSLIEAEQIETILKAIRQNFKVDSKVEICIECNPESIDEPKLKKFLNYGVSRISLGIQSFNPKTLLRVARPHDDKTIFKALEAIKKSGFQNFGADFIMGLPYQTLSSFKKELKTILAYEPPHLSCYFLSYDTKRIDLFKADSPSDDDQIKMYEHLTKTLKKNGYHHYEVSNYAKPGYESIHNQRYWEQKEYLGLGLGAHSYINKTVWDNEQNFDAYLKNPLATHEKIEIDPELNRMEYILLRLRTSAGIDQKTYEQKFGTASFSKMLARAQSFIESGHLIYKAQKLHPTDKGFLIIDHITKQLVDL